MSDLTWVSFVADFCAKNGILYNEHIENLRKSQDYMLAYREFLYGSPRDANNLLKQALDKLPKTP